MGDETDCHDACKQSKRAMMPDEMIEFLLAPAFSPEVFQAINAIIDAYDNVYVDAETKTEDKT
jgi:hypothetical protein